LSDSLGEQQDFGFHFIADFSGEIVGGFLGLGENDELAALEQFRPFQDDAETIPTWDRG